MFSQAYRTCSGQALQRARLAGEIRTVVDHRDLRRGGGEILDRVLLEQMHESLRAGFARIIGRARRMLPI